MSFNFYFYLIFYVLFFIFFIKKRIRNERKIKCTFNDFILNTFKKYKFKFYHSAEGHTFLFWPCYIRYVLLIIDKLPVEFSLLMPLLHLPLETTNRFIHPRHFFTILLSLYFFYHEYKIVYKFPCVLFLGIT